jgi:hypothetical protein
LCVLCKLLKSLAKPGSRLTRQARTQLQLGTGNADWQRTCETPLSPYEELQSNDTMLEMDNVRLFVSNFSFRSQKLFRAASPRCHQLVVPVSYNQNARYTRLYSPSSSPFFPFHIKCISLRAMHSRQIFWSAS